MKNRKVQAALLVVGLVDSVYLTIVHFFSKVLACPETGIINCGTVLNSSYSVVFGIPLAVLGLLWILAGFVVVWKFKGKLLDGIWAAAGGAGLVYSIFSMLNLGKICIYCSVLDVFILVLILPL